MAPQFEIRCKASTHGLSLYYVIHSQSKGIHMPFIALSYTLTKLIMAAQAGHTSFTKVYLKNKEQASGRKYFFYTIKVSL